MKRPSRLLLVPAFAALLCATASLSVWAQGSAKKNPADVKITMLMHPVLYAATGGKDGLITAFQKSSGYTIEVITAPFDQILEKTTIDFVSGTCSYDLFTYNDTAQHQGLARFLLPLDEYINKAGPAYDFSDFIPSAVSISNFGGKNYGIPFRYGVYMLHYRMDLFEKYRVKVPETWDDLLGAAKQITEGLRKDGIRDVYGIVFPGEAGLIIYEVYKTWLAGHGGYIVDKNGKIRINSPEAVKALENLVALYRGGWASPETPGMSLDKSIAAFQGGKAAISLSYSPYWGLFNDPTKSQVAGKVGWGLTPHAPGVVPGRSSFSGWQLLVNKNTKYPDQVWELVEALTNKAAMLDQAMNYANGPTRKTVLATPDFVAKFPVSRGWIAGFNASEPVLPGGHEKIGRMMDVIGREVSSALIGQKTAQKALDDAAKRIGDIYKE